MALDREPWPAEFTATGPLPWRCPYCQRALLVINKGTLHDGQTKDSLESQQHPASEPEWIDGRFSCMLSCSSCSGQVAVAGVYRVKDDRHYDPIMGESGDYEIYYRPRYFSDAPHIISIPERTPEQVAIELTRGFHLFWADPEACANRIRTSVEHLLTHQRIPKTNGTAAKAMRKKRTFLSLHARIELYEAKNPQIATALMAVKWIGNAGSHSSSLTAGDALDGFELMEYVLDELFVQRAARIGALSRHITRRRGPRSRRRGN